MGQAADQLTATQPHGAAPSAEPSSAEHLRAQIEQQRAELGRDLETLGDKVSPGRMVERRREAVRNGFRGMKDRVMGVADSTTSTVSDTAGAVGERLGQAPDAARQATQGNPLAVGLMAFGAGAVLAAMLPASEKERRLAARAQPAIERAAGEAATVARQEVDELRPMAQEAAQAVKDSAQQAAEEVKQQAAHP